MLPSVVAVDANVLISAVIGGRALDVLRDPRAPQAMATPEVCEEVVEHIPRLAEKFAFDTADLMNQFVLLPITVADIGLYAPMTNEAQQRMEQRDPDDWPTVALALALSLPIWSQDKDMSVSGLTVYSTGQLLDILRDLPTG